MATNLYFVDDFALIYPTTGSKASSLPKANNNVTYTDYGESMLAPAAPGGGNLIERILDSRNNTTQQSHYFGRFSSKPLAAQTIPAQTWNWRMVVSEGNASANTFLWPVMYVWRPSNNTVVGYIFNASANQSTEWPTSPAGSTRSLSGTAVTCLDGDILVVEAWGVATQAAAASYTQKWRSADPNSYVASPYTIVFQSRFYLYPGKTAATASPTAGSKATSLPLAINTSFANVTVQEFKLNITGTNSPEERFTNSVATLSPQSLFFGRYSTPALAGQTIAAQTWDWEISAGQGYQTNTLWWPVLYVWRPSNNTVVGYILNASTGMGNPWNYAADPNYNQVFNGASVTTLDGDLLVLELWGVNNQVSADTYVNHVWTEALNSRIGAQNTIYLQGQIPANASLNITEAGDSLSASGTVADPVINVSLTKTEAADIVVASGTVDVKTNLTKTEAPDTISVTGSVAVSAALTKTEGGDTLVSAGSVAITAALTVIESGDVLGAMVAADIAASLSVTEAPDTLSAAGTLDVLANQANLNIIETPDTLVASGSVVVGASLDKIESPDVLSTSVTSSITASLTIAEAGDTLGSVVNVSNFASFVKVEAPDTLLASTGAIIGATLTKTEGGDSLVAAGGSPPTDSKGIIFEFGPDTTITNGTFNFRSDAIKTITTVKGAAPYVEGDFLSLVTATPYVLTTLADLSGPSVISRKNGSQTDMDVAALGGQFGNYKLYLGAAANNRDPFQGRLYQLIIRGAASNAAQIIDIENIVAMKTGSSVAMANEVEVMPGVIRRVNRNPQWYQFSPPPWIMLVLVTVCISMLLTGCAIAVNDKESEVYMNEVIEYLTWSLL
jgi:hypothetical protein